MAIEDSIRLENAPKCTAPQPPVGLGMDEVEWKEIDPFEGRAGDPDPAMLERAPTSWPAGEPMAFRFDLAGRLVLPK